MPSALKKDQVYPSYDGATQLFTSTLHAFKDSLPEEERKILVDFCDAQSMIQSVKEQIDRAPEKRRLLSSCAKIEKFAKKWEPFFDIIDIFVNTHPEWAGLAWGAIRLVFKLSSHYAAFFEKLADMFERIAQHLPQYKLHVQFFADRGRPSSTQALLTALSHVYTDIIIFCQEACKIFSAKKRGVYYKLSVIKDLFWKPFDIRFANLLRRLAKHQELYELELSLADRGELLQHYQKFDKELEQAAEHRQTQGQIAQTEEKDALRCRIREIKHWVNCSDYMTTFEREKANLTAATGQWLLLEPNYLSWLRAPSDDSRHQTFAARVLTVYGSPGYGKTVLSIVVIEDIASQTVSNMQGPDVSLCSVAFFHFDKMTPSCTESHQAMRAILTQIIHQNQSDKDLVDIASLLMDSDGTGQPHASEQEIASVLALALQHSQNLTLVIDGLDECSNPLQFVQMLYAISQKSSCKIVIFSRPNFQLRQPFLSGNPTIRLRLNSNLSDMQQFLRPQIKEMFVMNLLSPRFGVEEVVFKISTRANSLFLWTKLMLSYLQCLALTPREREEAIDNLNLLEGLDAIFKRIVGTIQNRLQPERQIAFRIFQWLAVAYRPLRLTELRTALAIRLQKPSCSELDYIANFGQALPTICGALVELREDGTVQFIHLSANEYLTDKDTFASIYTPGNLHVDMPTAHLAVAGYALSYLLFDVPNSPLSGSSKVAPDKRHLLDQHPLLEYSLNWCNHAADGLPVPDDLSKSYVDVGCSFLLLASDFLNKRSAVTTWIEARWVFCSTIQETRQLFERTQYQHTLSPNVSPTAQDILKKFDRLASSLRRVSDDIEYLNQEWKHVLKEQPNQIWEPSINMFRESEFLIGTTSAKISWKGSDLDPLISDKSHGIPGKHNPEAKEARSLPLPLASQVSADGRLLASVTLIQPPGFDIIAGSWFLPDQDNLSGVLYGLESTSSDDMDSCDDGYEFYDVPRRQMRGKTKLLDVYCVGWKVRYQSWALYDQQSTVHDLEISLPESHIFNMLLTSFHSMAEGEFRIPICFSPDLLTLTIMQSVVRISSLGYATQTLDDVILSSFHGLVRSTPSYLQTSFLDMTDAVWYHATFSTSCRFLAVVRSGRVPIDETDCHLSRYPEYTDCSLAIFEDQVSSNTNAPNYRLVAVQGPLATIGGVGRPVAIHPTDGVLAVVQDEKTYLWKFSNAGLPRISVHGICDSAAERLIEVLGEPLNDMVFSPCGQYLLGNCLDCEDQPIIISLRNFTQEHPEIQPLQDLSLIHTSAGGNSGPSHLAISHLQMPPVQSAGSVVLTLTKTGRIQQSTLKQYDADSAIILSSVSQDGIVRTAELLRLPLSGSAGSSYPTLLNTSDGDAATMRIVLNKAAQNTYNFEQSDGLVLPLILEREKKTITTHTTKRELGWEDGEKKRAEKRMKVVKWLDDEPGLADT